MIKTTLGKMKVGFNFKLYEASEVVRKKVTGDELFNTQDIETGFKQKFKQSQVVYINSELGLK